jgi:hypothetical protein
VKRLIGGSLFLVLAMPLAAAAQQGGFLDLMYAPEPELELSDPSDSITFDGGSGLSLRGRVLLDGIAFLQGEYVANDYKEVEGVDFDAESSLLRFGLGGKSADSPLYGLIEFVKLEIDLVDADFSADDTGYAMSVGLQGAPGDRSTLYAQLGYLDIGDFGDGLEFSVGGAFGIGDRTALLIDYRQSTTEDDSNAEGTFSDLRIGLRIAMGS